MGDYDLYQNAASHIRIYTVYYHKYATCYKILNNFFLFSAKMLVIRTGIHKMLARIANRDDPRSALFVYANLARQLGFKILEYLP